MLKIEFKKIINIVNKALSIFFVFIIKLYQTTISPYTRPSCRFLPTCSQYGLECFKHFNVFKASFFLIKRILKCHPFSHGGFDPVIHEKINKFKY